MWELSCDLQAVNCVSVLFGPDRECAVSLQLPSVFTVRAFSARSYRIGLVALINPLKPSAHYIPHSGHYMYRQFNIQQFHVQPPQCIYVFCVDRRTNSDYFPIHH